VTTLSNRLLNRSLARLEPLSPLFDTSVLLLLTVQSTSEAMGRNPSTPTRNPLALTPLASTPTGDHEPPHRLRILVWTRRRGRRHRRLLSGRRGRHHQICPRSVQTALVTMALAAKRCEITEVWDLPFLEMIGIWPSMESRGSCHLPPGRPLGRDPLQCAQRKQTVPLCHHRC
jgi:hypothetical protein